MRRWGEPSRPRMAGIACVCRWRAFFVCKDVNIQIWRIRVHSKRCSFCSLEFVVGKVFGDFEDGPICLQAPHHKWHGWPSIAVCWSLIFWLQLPPVKGMDTPRLVMLLFQDPWSCSKQQVEMSSLRKGKKLRESLGSDDPPFGLFILKIMAQLRCP